MDRNYVTFFLVSLLLLAGPSYVMLSSPQFDYCEGHQGQYPANPTTNNQPSAVLIPNNEQRRIFVSCLSSFTTENSSAITAWATILLTLVTAGLVVVAVEQSETKRAQLRAYVLPESIGLFDGNTVSPPQPAHASVPYWNVRFKNAGQTPAYDVVSWGDLAVVQITDEDRLLKPPKKLDKVNPFTLGPGVPFPKTRWYSRALTPAEITGISVSPPTHAIYVHGRLEYRDAFRTRHFTNFRFSYCGAWPPGQNVSMSYCKEGNNSD
jgi:hypothetical protein